MTVLSSAQLSGTFNGQTVAYSASVEQFDARSDRSVLGSVSVFSYTAANQDASAPRPVIFAFNGGPGAASTFLHLGGLGPRRVSIPTDLSQGVLPPYEVADHEHSVLDVADLVFIDPINTGLGRASADTKPESFYSLEGDARYFADVIRQWLAAHDRWNSPKYLLGESYGTQRAPFLAAALMSPLAGSVPVDGLILLGQAINVQETLQRPGNIMSAIASLPFLAATARFHGKGAYADKPVMDVVREALKFAFGEYANALMAGRRLPEVDRARVVRSLSDWIGLPENFILKQRLVVSKDLFKRQLLSDQGLMVGTYDSRYVGTAADATVGELDGEPSNDALLPGFYAGAKRQLAALGVAADADYRFLDPAASAQWDWSDAGSNRLNILGKSSPFSVFAYAATLTQYMKRVAQSRLFIGTGVYDGLTTVGAVEHLLRQYDIPLDRVTEARYEGGHMMYSDPGSAEQLCSDLRSFLLARR